MWKVHHFLVFKWVWSEDFWKKHTKRRISSSCRRYSSGDMPQHLTDHHFPDYVSTLLVERMQWRREKGAVTCALNVMLDWVWFPALYNTTQKKFWKGKKQRNVHSVIIAFAYCFQHPTPGGQFMMVSTSYHKSLVLKQLEYLKLY
jgi:hypothetical protein